MSQLTEFLTDTVAFHRRHKTVAAMVWLTSSISAALPTFPHRFAGMPAFVVIAALVAALAFYMLTRYEKTLEARIAATDGGPVWQVQINGVTVGEMKDANYAAIRRIVLCDGRLHVAQLFNFGTVAMRMVDYLFTAIPLGAFWLAIGCFFFAPDSFAVVLAAIQKVTPAQAVAAIPMLARILVWVSFLALAAHFAIGRRFGFVNQFDQACGSRVRRAIDCAADGEVSLYRIDNGTCVVPDELATIRTKR